MECRERETGVIVRQKKERYNGKKEWRRGNGERREAEKERVNWIWERGGMIGRHALGKLVRRRERIKKSSGKVREVGTGSGKEMKASKGKKYRGMERKGRRKKCSAVGKTRMKVGGKGRGGKRKFDLKVWDGEES